MSNHNGILSGNRLYFPRIPESWCAMGCKKCIHILYNMHFYIHLDIRDRFFRRQFISLTDPRLINPFAFAIWMSDNVIDCHFVGVSYRHLHFAIFQQWCRGLADLFLLRRCVYHYCCIMSDLYFIDFDWFRSFVLNSHASTVLHCVRDGSSMRFDVVCNVPYYGILLLAMLLSVV